MDENGALGRRPCLSPLNNCIALGNWLPLRESVCHHSLVGVAAGGGHRVGHRAPNPQRRHGPQQFQHLPRQGLGGPPGRHLQTDRQHDDPHRHHSGWRSRSYPTLRDTVTATFRSPTFTNKPGSSPAQDASFSSLRSGQLDAAQPSRASLRSPALPGPRFRPPPAAEARAASRVAKCAQAPTQPCVPPHSPDHAGLRTGSGHHRATCGNRPRNVMSAWHNVKSG